MIGAVMKNRLLLLSIVLLSSLFPALSQSGKKPTIMILPSDNWCAQRYFMTRYENQGSTIEYPNYQQAFLDDTELGLVISKVGEILTSYGYSLKDAEREIKNISIKTAEDNVTTSKTSGAFLSESPVDVLKRRIKSDIIIQLWWKVNKEKKGHSVSFTLEAFDAYTNKRIATSTGTGKSSSNNIPLIIEKAVTAKIKSFDNQMSQWYNQQITNGREISLTIRCWDNLGNDLETIYDNEELADCIQNWLYENTVNHEFNYSDGSESFIQFEQVKIPVFDNRGRAMDARSFATELRKHLQRPPYNIISKVMVRGLGEAIIILGEK